MSVDQSFQAEPVQRDRSGDAAPPAPPRPQPKSKLYPQEPPRPDAPQKSGQQPAQQPAQPPPQHGGNETEIPKDLPKPGLFSIVVVSLVLIGCLIGLFILGWIPHQRAAEQAKADAADQVSGAPSVTILQPRVQTASKDVVLPCSVRAWASAALYSRATGYLKRWTFDIGSRVKQGDLLAVISAPDVNAQLNQTKAALDQAKATVVKSQADVDVALTDYHRYLKSQKDNPGSVTDEDVNAKRGAWEDAVGALKVANAAVDQDIAAVQQLAVSQGFEQITAPFSGTITARNYDVGALITASNTAAGAELFDIADADTLRVFVNVPQTYATRIRVGQSGYLTVRNYAGREFQGTVARMAGALDPTTRTIPFEVDFPNSDGALFAGMYGTARLPTTEPKPPLVIPSSALIFNAAGSQVAVVRDGKIHFQRITVGRDLGTDLEITSGLTADDSVVTNPGERLVEGVEVDITPQDKPAGESTTKP